MNHTGIKKTPQNLSVFLHIFFTKFPQTKSILPFLHIELHCLLKNTNSLRISNCLQVLQGTAYYWATSIFGAVAGEFRLIQETIFFFFFGNFVLFSIHFVFLLVIFFIIYLFCCFDLFCFTVHERLG